MKLYSSALNIEQVIQVARTNEPVELELSVRKRLKETREPIETH